MPFEPWLLSRAEEKEVGRHCAHLIPQRRRGWLLLLVLLIFAVPPEVEAQSPTQGLDVLGRGGEIALDSGNFDSAVAKFEAARQLVPEDLEVNPGLLLSYLRAGRLAQAASVERNAVERWSQDVE